MEPNTYNFRLIFINLISRYLLVLLRASINFEVLNSFLTFIPARGGSKSIPKKNIAILGSKPLIAYTLDVCNRIDDMPNTLISTDDEEIASYCSSEGYETDYRRPKNLSADDSVMVDAVLHGVEWYEQNHNCRITDLLILQPTSPLRKLEDVKSSVEHYISNNIQSLVSVTYMKEHPSICVEQNIEGKNWEYLREPTKTNSQRQDFEGVFGFIDGSIYIVSQDFLREHNSIIVPGETELYFTNQRYAIDIDEPEDLALAQLIVKSIE